MFKSLLLLLSAVSFLKIGRVTLTCHCNMCQGSVCIPSILLFQYFSPTLYTISTSYSFTLLLYIFFPLSCYYLLNLGYSFYTAFSLIVKFEVKFMLVTPVGGAKCVRMPAVSGRANVTCIYNTPKNVCLEY